MFKKLLLSVITVLILVVAYAATKPSEYMVFREVSINAPAEKIFTLINNSRETERWMPWAETDPKMKMSYSGPESGVGSKASWESPGQMGVGSSTISESAPNQSVKYSLEYTKPFQMKQTAEISITPSGGKNVVRWSVWGHNKLFCRVVCLFMDMDKMVGGSFEQGLNKLKVIAEG